MAAGSGISPFLRVTMSLTFVFVASLFLAPALAYQELSDQWLQDITIEADDFDINDGKLLSPILIPRVPGTPGQKKVQQHFVDFFTKELPDWKIEWQNSTGTTPATGSDQVPFQNIIIRREPPWAKPNDINWLTLVAHYDSKLEPEGFIGAIDSAAPCAMLMHLARALDGNITQMHELISKSGDTSGKDFERDIGVQILLLDGEEAFVSWTATDSLYGSRSLAEEWETTVNPALSTYRNPLQQIEVFVLLDLLGSADPKIPSYFPTTHWAYQRMATVEHRMRKLGVLETEPKRPFLPDGDLDFKDIRAGGIGDDHQPFMFRGVPILHMIPSPFPFVWHKIEDDGEHLDMPTVRDWTRIVTGFTMEWMNLMSLELGLDSADEEKGDEEKGT